MHDVQIRMAPGTGRCGRTHGSLSLAHTSLYAAIRSKRRPEAGGKAEGCDVLLTKAVFNGLDMDRSVLAETIRYLNPRGSIIFVIGHADRTAAPGA